LEGSTGMSKRVKPAPAFDPALPQPIVRDR
jgi:hypothetical protein